jgi:hypothetical protein
LKVWDRSALLLDRAHEASLPRCLDGSMVVVGSRPLRRVVGVDTAKNGEHGKRHAGAANAATAGNFHTFDGRTLVCLSKYRECLITIYRRTEISTANPPVLPREGRGPAPEKVDTERWMLTSRRAVSKAASAYASAIWKLHKSRRVSRPGHVRNVAGGV